MGEITTFYIAGPIQGYESRQEYRSRIRNSLARAGIRALDPWEEEKRQNEFANGHSPPQAQRLIRKRLKQVEDCDGIVAYLPKESAGTLYELIWARIHRKKIYVICPMENPSPWITGLSPNFYSSLRQFNLRFGRIKTSSRKFTN